MKILILIVTTSIVPCVMGTSLKVGDNFLSLKHATENGYYYEGSRSYNLSTWQVGLMPYFLGTGEELEISTLIPTSAIESSNFFFKVEKKDPLGDFDENDHPPIPVIQYIPLYPTDLRRDGVEGDVSILFTIGTDGHVYNPEIESSTHEDFSSAVLFVITYWRFYPAAVDGELTSARVRVPIPFRIR